VKYLITFQTPLVPFLYHCCGCGLKCPCPYNWIIYWYFICCNW